LLARRLNNRIEVNFEIQLFVCSKLDMPSELERFESHYCESWLRPALCSRSSFDGHR